MNGDHMNAEQTDVKITGALGAAISKDIFNRCEVWYGDYEV